MDPINRRKRVTEEAAEWWLVLQGDVSRAQREHYVDWLRESSVHIAEMLHIAQVHGALEQFERWSSLPIDGSREDDSDNVITLPAVSHQASRWRGTRERAPHRRLAWAAAAMVFILTGIGVSLLLGPNGAIIQTERGERREVSLADGSVVQVDPETRLRIAYAEHTRRVFLERGRALFHVAKNTARPFLVEANSTTVRAVGTAFAVEQQSQVIVVTVAEGKVGVFPAHSLLDEAAPAGAEGSAQAPRKHPTDAASPLTSSNTSGSDSAPRNSHSGALEPAIDHAAEIFLTANQQVTVLRSGSAQPVRAINSDRALAWAEGRLVFENTSVSDAVRQFNRYNRVQLVVNDIDLARRPISGIFSASDPDSFAAFIKSVARVRITRSDSPDITIDTAP
jgi:transmembrane sensor